MAVKEQHTHHLQVMKTGNAAEEAGSIAVHKTEHSTAQHTAV
jgi:hypothetical protein